MRRMAVVWCTLCGVLLLSVPTVGAAEKEVGPVYTDKASFFELGGQTQFRYEYVEAEGDEDPESGFNFRRVRLFFSGNLTDNLYFATNLQLDDLPESMSLSSTYIGYRLGPLGNLEAGRFTTNAFHRPSSKRMLLTERSRHVTRNNPGSERGLYYDNTFFKKHAFLELGMFNGSGDTSDGNENNNFLYLARAGVGTSPKFGFTTQGDLKNSDWEAGIEGGGWVDHIGERDSEYEGDVSVVGGAVMVRGKGFFAEGSYSWRRSNFEDDAVDDYTAKGWDVTASYAIPIPGTKMFIEPAARYERWDDSDGPGSRDAGAARARDGDIAWTTAGVNWYLKKHNAKFQMDYTWKDERGDTEDVDNDTFVVQGQILF